MRLHAAIVVLSLLAGTASAEIIWKDDFEKSRPTGYNGGMRQKQLVMTETVAHSGKRCLEIQYVAGGTGPSLMLRLKKQVDTIYYRYYRMFPNEWKWPTGYGPHDTLVFAGKYQNPTTTDLSVYTDFWRTGKTFFRIASTNQERGYGGWNEFQRHNHNRGRHKIEPGKWFCVETMAKLSTPGGTDGEIRIWIDGKLITEVKGLPLRDKNHPDIHFNRWFLGPYFHNGTSQAQSSYMDDLVISTEYIGPMGYKKPGRRKKTRKKSLVSLAPPRPADPLAPFAKDLAAAEKSMREGKTERAEAAYRKILPGIGKDHASAKDRITLRIQGTAERGGLIGRIVDGLDSRGAKSVYIDLFGRNQRARIVGATADKGTFEVMGSRMSIAWPRLSHRRIAQIATKYAASSRCHLSVALFLMACGDREAARKAAVKALEAEPTAEDRALARRISRAAR